MFRAAVIALVVLSTGLGCAQSRRQVSPVFWHEGEDYLDGPNNRLEGVAAKLPGSGGEALYGPVLSARPGYVRYRLDLPRDIADARLVLRHSRGYWTEPSRVGITLVSADRRITTSADLPDTGGWGTTSKKDWQVAAVEIGTLPGGVWEMTLSAGLEEHGDVNIDGFFIVPGSIEINGEELAAADRIHIDSRGYVGIGMASATIVQDEFEGFELVARAFFPRSLGVRVTVLDSDDREVAVLHEGDSMSLAGEAKRLLVAGGPLRSLDDGFYTVRTQWESAPALDLPVQLVGVLASTHGQRLAAIVAFHEELRSSQDASKAGFIPDYEHAIDFLRTGWEKVLRGEADRDLVEGIGRTLRQYELMSGLISEGRDPYVALHGDLRLAFRSEATGKTEPYRLFLPDSYRADGSTPVLMALNGTEDRFLDGENAVVKPVANRRGYAIISPRASSGYWGRGRHDLVQVLEHVLTEFPGIDASRVYCTGASAGGFGTYGLATAHPEVFAAIACASGAGNWRRYARPDRELVEVFTRVPTLILHGEIDALVPPETVLLLAQRLEERGYPHELHIFPSHGHSYGKHAEQYLTMSLDYFERYTKEQ